MHRRRRVPCPLRADRSSLNRCSPALHLLCSGPRHRWFRLCFPQTHGFPRCLLHERPRSVRQHLVAHPYQLQGSRWRPAQMLNGETLVASMAGGVFSEEDECAQGSIVRRSMATTSRDQAIPNDVSPSCLCAVVICGLPSSKPLSPHHIAWRQVLWSKSMYS